MLIKRKSPISGIEREMDLPITYDQWAKWNGPNPPHVQNCFPNLNADQREFILTGISSDEWDEIFKEEEDEPGILFDNNGDIGC